MKDNWLKKLINEARRTKLQITEKKRMISKILGPSRVPSPYYFYASSFVRDYHRRAVALAIILALVATSGGTSYAAENSLPGEALYSIKVNVNEEIKSFVALSANGRARIGVERTGKRLDEAEKLSKQGKLTAETKAIIETNLKKHTETIKENIATLASENATATVKEVVSDLTASIEVHEAALASISSSTVSSSTSEKIGELIDTVNDVKTEINVIGDIVAGTSTPGVATSTATSTEPIDETSTSTPSSDINPENTGTSTGTEQTITSETSPSIEPRKIQ